MLRIVCVNAGNYCGRGAEYVNILHDSVNRNLSQDTEYVFECFTDDPTGLNEGIVARELHGGLSGWWNKLYLFKQGLFPEGDRIVYFDLDTVIVSGLDDIVKYNGSFAILRDVYRHDGLQSSVMMWQANKKAHLWDLWLGSGCAKIEGGDQA